MPGPHAEPVPGRYQGGSFPLRPVGELAPFPHTVCPGSGGKAAVLRPAQWVNQRPFPASSAPNRRQSGSFPPCPWVNLSPCSTPSAPNRRQGGSLSACRMGGHQNRPSHTLRRFKLRNSPLFPRSFAFMREKRKMYSVQKFLCPSGTIASALKIVPKPIDNLRRVLYNATMLLR